MKKKLLILFLFLSILVVVGCKKKEEVKEKQADEVRELKEDELEALKEKVGYLYYFDINPAKSFKTSELTNQEVLLWAIGFSDNASGVPFSDYEQKAMEYLDYSLEPEDILCMTHYHVLGTSDYKYHYDVETKSFKENKSHAKHSEIGYYAYVVNRYLDSKYENGEYKITYSKLFSDTDAFLTASSDVSKNRNWYKTYFDAQNKQNAVINKANYEYAQDFLDKMSSEEVVKYTYTFVLKDGNYVLKSYEIEK